MSDTGVLPLGHVLAVRGPGTRPALVVAVDPVRVDAARLGDRERQELEADDVDGRMPRRHEGRLAAERRAAPRRRRGHARRRGPRLRARRRARSRRSRPGGRGGAARCGARRPRPRRPRAASAPPPAPSASRGPAPATRIFDCAGTGSVNVERRLDRVRRATRRPRRAARRSPRPRTCSSRCGTTTARPPACRRRPRRRGRRAASRPRRSRATSARRTPRAASTVSGVVPSCETHTIRSASGGASTASSACTAQPAGLRGVERRAAPGEDDARPVGQPPVARNGAQPLGLGEHRATCLSGHGLPL